MTGLAPTIKLAINVVDFSWTKNVISEVEQRNKVEQGCVVEFNLLLHQIVELVALVTNKVIVLNFPDEVQVPTLTLVDYTCRTPAFRLDLFVVVEFHDDGNVVPELVGGDTTTSNFVAKERTISFKSKELCRARNFFS